jgi:hypothetical protein
VADRESGSLGRGRLPSARSPPPDVHQTRRRIAGGPRGNRRRAQRIVVATNGDNTNIVCAQIAQKRYGIGCVVVRILDPARSALYAELGMRTVCPTTAAIDILSESVMSHTAVM